MRAALPCAAILLATSLTAAPVAAHDSGGGAGEAGAGQGSLSEVPAGTDLSVAGAARGLDERKAVPVRWHGSTLSFDQSATTQTLGVGGDYQSANPTYEWWLAFKPRYFLYEKNADAVSLNLWMNLYLELTNSDTTTRLREWLLGPTYLWATYAHTLRDQRGYRTVVSVGPRLIIPTDKAARDSGQILGAGASAGASQTFPLRGGGARVWRGARLGVSATFLHPFNRATAPVNDGIHQLRQDVAGRTVISDQLRGEMNVKSALSLSVYGEVQVLRRLDLSASYVVLNSWTYAPSDAPICSTLTGCVAPISVDDPTTYRVSTWLTASVGYDVTDELSLSLGYYNLASQIGPDGTRRSPIWSPSARFFLTAVGNLDAIYQRLRGRPTAARSVARTVARTP